MKVARRAVRKALFKSSNGLDFISVSKQYKQLVTARGEPSELQTNARLFSCVGMVLKGKKDLYVTL